MGQNTSLDLLIVGGGLAGSLLAWLALERGLRVKLVDDHWRGSSSRIAAGLINPVTGQRFVRDPQAPELLRVALALYRRLGQRFGTRFFHPLPMFRLLLDQRASSNCERRLMDPAYRGWLRWEPQLPSGLGPGVAGCRQRHTGYLDVAGLIRCLHDWLDHRGLWLHQALDYGALQLDGQVVGWQGLRARWVVFCEGHRVLHNPWFSDQAWQPARGEILRLRLERPPERCILNAGHWLVPSVDGDWRLGATFEPGRLDLEPDPVAGEALLASLPRMLCEPGHELLEQQVGIRPNTRHKQPLVGCHPRHRQLVLCNGFGSRGSLLMPLWLGRLAEALALDQPPRLAVSAD